MSYGAIEPDEALAVHGPVYEPHGFLDLAWDAAADPTCPEGVFRIDGQPFPLCEYDL